MESLAKAEPTENSFKPGYFLTPSRTLAEIDVQMLEAGDRGDNNPARLFPLGRLGAFVFVNNTDPKYDYSLHRLSKGGDHDAKPVFYTEESKQIDKLHKPDGTKIDSVKELTSTLKDIYHRYTDPLERLGARIKTGSFPKKLENWLVENKIDITKVDVYFAPNFWDPDYAIIREEKVTKKVNILKENNFIDDPRLPRPDSWHGIIGQEDVVTQLKSIAEAINTGNLNQRGIILHGPTNVNKNLIANALAKDIGADAIMINCTIDPNIIYSLENAIQKAKSSDKKVLVILGGLGVTKWGESVGIQEDTKSIAGLIKEAINQNPNLIIVGTTDYNPEDISADLSSTDTLSTKIECSGEVKSANEVVDCIASELYKFLAKAKYHINKLGRNDRLVGLENIIDLHPDNLNKLKSLANQLIGYTQVNINEGISIAIYQNISMNGDLKPLTADEIYIGIANTSRIQFAGFSSG